MNGFNEQALLGAARDMVEFAYAPYSGFGVGAALLDDRGRIHTGANIENAAYPATLCAERVALARAIMSVSTGDYGLVALAVYAPGPGPCTPCGLCRQVLYEFAPDLVVLASGGDGSMRRYLLHELLPDGFDTVRLRGGAGY